MQDLLVMVQPQVHLVRFDKLVHYSTCIIFIVVFVKAKQMYCNERISTSPKDDCFIANLSCCSKIHPKSTENLQIKSCCHANKCMWNSRMLWEVFSLKPFPLLQTHRLIMLKQCAQNSPTPNMCMPYCNSYDQAKIPVATSSLTVYWTLLSRWCR